MTTPDPPRKRQTLRVEDELWKPFLQATMAVERLSGAAVLRRDMQRYLDEYRIFWAEASPGNPEKVAWFDCVECDRPHRLDGTGTPWGCTVTKARQDREEKARAASSSS